MRLHPRLDGADELHRRLGLLGSDFGIESGLYLESVSWLVRGREDSRLWIMV
jgi:hypothetical protein